MNKKRVAKMNICKVCNGLDFQSRACSLCGHQLENAGRMDDYEDPYSAYMEMDSSREREAVCIHLFRCGRCGSERAERIIIG